MPYAYNTTFLVTHTVLNVKFTIARTRCWYIACFPNHIVESQNGCMDNSNPNSVIGSTVDQLETPVRADISTRRFSLSVISVVNLLITFLYFSSDAFFISVLR